MFSCMKRYCRICERQTKKESFCFLIILAKTYGRRLLSKPNQKCWVKEWIENEIIFGLKFGFRVLKSDERQSESDSDTANKQLNRVDNSHTHTAIAYTEVDSRRVLPAHTHRWRTTTARRVWSCNRNYRFRPRITLQNLFHKPCAAQALAHTHTPPLISYPLYTNRLVGSRAVLFPIGTPINTAIQFDNRIVILFQIKIKLRNRFVLFFCKK